MFSFLKPKQQTFFSVDEEAKIVDAIRAAEKETSGEIRLYIESKCRFVDPLDRAIEVFFNLQMGGTVNRNGVLVYIATEHRQLALIGDVGIFERTGQQFWNDHVKLMLDEFKKENYAEGLVEVIYKIGQSLHSHFPYDAATDKNELPDDIVFGR